MASDALLYLHKNGVTDQDIILISQLLSDIKNNKFPSNSLNNQNNSNNKGVYNSILDPFSYHNQNARIKLQRLLKS